MLTDHIHEDHAARKYHEARNTSAALFKAALRDPIPITGPLDGVTVALYKGLRDQRPRSDVVPLVRKAAPSPARPLPPAVPLRPAAGVNHFGKLSQAPDRKHRPTTLDANARRELGDLLRSMIRTAGAR